MANLRPLALAGTLLTALAPGVTAKPNLSAPRPLGSLTVYADDQRPGLFFYGPGELAVVRDADGRPDIHFMQVRYTGSVVHADRGRIVQRSLLTFRVAMRAPSPADLQAARRVLAAGPGPVELRPLPICRLEAALVYAPVGRSEDSASALPAGHFEDAESAASVDPGAFWATRSYSLGLDPQSSELFWAALTNGQVVLSLSYGFYATGAAPSSTKELVGPAPAVSALRRVVAGRAKDEGGEAEARGAEQLVSAGAFSVSVDADRWPDLFRRVDINERVPPGYPLLDVYCYDFRDSLHPALYEKQVEVEAEGVGGGPVGARVRFGRDQPDLYARGVRFGVAVRLDRPYRYRVTEITVDGNSTAAAWRERSSWTEVLDVTTAQEPAAGGPDRPGEER